MIGPTSTRQPTSETGLYLSHHVHRWQETGTYSMRVGGPLHPSFTCRVCGDVIADIHQEVSS